MNTTRDLYIVRHAKSDWTEGSATDFDRPLSKRGIKDAPRLARWLVSANITPALLISSPARRAAQTTAAIAEQLGLSQQNITHDRRLYLASVPTLIEVIHEVRDSCLSLMLVGHNPGLESLILKYSADPLPYTANGKLLTTANLVHLQFQHSWQHIADHQGRLKHFIRPKELP